MPKAIAVAPTQAFRALLLAVAVLLPSGGCTAVNSHQAGRTTFALNQTECNQSDSTVSCCLKRHPYEPERCGAELPAGPSPTPIRLPPPGATDSNSTEELPQPEERERWRKICEPHYTKCIGKGGDSIPGRVHKETQCKACYEYCMRKGFWPYSANGKRCPGG